MIIITGTIAYDYIMDFPGNFSEHILPNQTHNINLSFIVNTFAKRRGGTAGNVSYTLGLLSTPHTLFSLAGKDFDEYKKKFIRLGINVDHITIDKKTYTATGFAMTDKNDNQIWGYFYGAAEGMDSLNIKTLAKPKDFVLIGPSGAKGSMSFVRQCTELKIPYMFDPGFILTQVNDQDLAYGVSHAAYIIGNDYEIHLIKNRLKNWKTLFAEKIIITTLGEKGAHIENGHTIYTIGAALPQKLVDPTGAGDAWRAGFLAGMERNFDLQTNGQMGAVAASFAVEEYGTQEHTFSKKEFCKRYKDRFKLSLDLGID